MKSFNVFILLSCLFVLFACGNSKEKASDNNRMATEDNTMILDSVTFSDTTFVDQDIFPSKKINKKNLVVREWNTDVRTNVRMLDHVTTFNAEGQKIEEIEYNSEGQKWRERYEYGTNGKKVRELIYDGHNRLVQVKKYQYNEYGKKTITYTYNSQGKLISIKNYEYITQE